MNPKQMHNKIQRLVEARLPEHVANEVTYRMGSQMADQHVAQMKQAMGIDDPSPELPEPPGVLQDVPQGGPVRADDGSFGADGNHVPAVLPKGRRI